MKINDVRCLKFPFARLVYWITEREVIRQRKEAGELRPWTDDEILRNYRFCNVRRMDDKVSRWILTNWYEPYRDHPNILVATALARFINNPEMLARVRFCLFPSKRGEPVAGTPHFNIIPGPIEWKDLYGVLNTHRKWGTTIFNAAYMVRGAKPGGNKLREVIYDYCRRLERAKVTIDPTSMERTHAAIAAQYGFGSFMAGQVTADLRWAVTGTWRDRRIWAPIGPGSRKGMNRIHRRPEDTTLGQEQFLDELRALIRALRDALPSKLTRRLEAMDYQNCLCEFSKYERTLAGEGRPKQRYAGGRGS